MLRNFLNARRAKALGNWIAGLRPLRDVPLPLSLYRDCLIRLATAPHIAMRSFEATPLPNVANLYHRHDIDTRRCLTNLPSMLEIDCELGVPVAVFLRPDDEPDTPSWSDALPVKRAYESRGIPFGLHTMCYAYSDAGHRLRVELDRFEKIFAARPSYLTFHGTGAVHMVQRSAFQRELTANLAEFGLLFGDFDPETRTYRHEITDCHLGPKTRFAKTDFLGVPPFVAGQNYVLLTHPCYWTV